MSTSEQESKQQEVSDLLSQHYIKKDFNVCGDKYSFALGFINSQLKILFQYKLQGDDFIQTTTLHLKASDCSCKGFNFSCHTTVPIIGEAKDEFAAVAEMRFSENETCVVVDKDLQHFIITNLHDMLIDLFSPHGYTVGVQACWYMPVEGQKVSEQEMQKDPDDFEYTNSEAYAANHSLHWSCLIKKTDGDH